MKKFHFPLEGILQLRKEEERNMMLALQQVRLRESMIMNEISRIQTEHAEWQNYYNHIGRSSDTTEEILLAEHYLVSLEGQEIRQKKFLKDIQPEIQKALARLQEAYKRKRQIEHLKEKQKNIYLEEFRKIEAREIDEISSLRFIHKKLMEENDHV